MDAGDRHLLDTLDAPRVLANVSEALFGDGPAASRLGRFVLLARLGAGGMGVVYSAFDPQLDRRVAIKVLHREVEDGSAQGSADDGERLLREARALAKLNHPNVVTVYEVGTVRSRVFIAMELVEGEALDHWIEQPRSVNEVLRVFRAAGRGLAAAHAQGLVHRDFKPANVMLGADGRVIVLDFGLARVERSATDSIRAQALRADQAEDTHDTVALMGTPMYMSPEQLTGSAVGHASDQFSFCVSLFEALTGERPFAGDSLLELAEAVGSGQPRTVERLSTLPPWLVAVLNRGLRPRAEDRFPSMEALLDALEGPPPPRWRRAVPWLATAAAGSVAVGAMLWSPSDEEPCTDSSAEVEAVWNEPRREAMREAFEATALPYAEDARRGATQRLDAYAQRWAEAHHDACAATRIRGEQSEALMRHRMACLDDRLASLDALAELLSQADAEVVPNAVAAAHQLPSLDDCADTTTLLTEDAGLDPQERERRVRLRRAIDRATTQRQAGKYEDARATLEAVLKEVGDGEDLWLRAEASLELGVLQEKGGEHEAAVRTVKQALWDAVQQGDASQQLRAAARLVTQLSVQLQRVDEARDYGELARATLPRMHDLRAGTAELESALSKLAYAEGDFATAVEHGARALELQQERLDPDDPRLATMHHALGVFSGERGHADEALHHFRRAVELRERALGPAHPRTATAYNGLAGQLARMGQLDDALAMHDKSLEVWKAAGGEDHVKVAMIHNNMANAIARAQREAEAIPHYLEAIRIWTAAGGHEISVAHAHANLGLALSRLGRHAEGLPHLEQALATYTEKLGAEHSSTARVLINLSYAHRELGHLDLALEHARHAVGIVLRDREREHPLFPMARTVEGDALAHLGRLDEAIAAFRDTVEVYRVIEISTVERSEAHLQLADLLLQRGEPSDEAQARALVHEALERARSGDDTSPGLVDQLEAWLREHGETPTP